MIISNPLNKPLLDEPTLVRLEGLCEYERFISVDRAVEYRDDVRPYVNPEDKFVEYEWPQDKNLIDYLIRQGEITTKNIVFKKTQRNSIAFNGERAAIFARGRPQYKELEI